MLRPIVYEDIVLPKQLDDAVMDIGYVDIELDCNNDM